MQQNKKMNNVKKLIYIINDILTDALDSLMHRHFGVDSGVHRGHSLHRGFSHNVSMLNHRVDDQHRVAQGVRWANQYPEVHGYSCDVSTVVCALDFDVTFLMLVFGLLTPCGLKVMGKS